MNKTVNINLGGIFYHIDENAYHKLNRYFDAIRSSLALDVRDEIMNDIESRVSELFSDKISASKQVLSLHDVDDVISIMGQPEDYKIEDSFSQEQSYIKKGKLKKLYRDKDNAKIAGVCAGLGHYFGVEAVWIRLALVLLFFASGSGLLAYAIMWIVTPEAITTSEKLEMNGEPITISNIEKKVKLEFESVSNHLKNTNYAQMSENVKEGAKQVSTTLGDVILKLLKVFAKILGVFMVFVASIVILSFLVALLFPVSSNHIKLPWINYFETFNFSDTSLWFVCLMSFFAIAIPFFFVLLLGVKILAPTLKQLNNIAKFTLLGVWLSSIIALIYLGIITSSELAFENKVVYKTYLSDKLSLKDTLTLKFQHNDYYSKDVDDNTEFELVQDESGNEFIYSNNVELEILPTDENRPFVQIEATARGKSLSEARRNAKEIRYNFKNTNLIPNQLLFDNYFIIDSKNKFRDHEVRIYLYLPVGMYIKPHQSLKNFDVTDSDYFTFYLSSNQYIYKVTKDYIKCINCDDEDIENEDNEKESSNDTTEDEVIINKNGIQIKSDTLNKFPKENNKIKELKINEQGITIKTK